MPAVSTSVYIQGENNIRSWLKEKGFNANIPRRSIMCISGVDLCSMASACSCGELEVCKWPYNHGAGEDVSYIDLKGNTPMHWACLMGHLEVSIWLSELAADDITRNNNSGATPMHNACLNGHIVVCKWLLSMQASIYCKNIAGETPMHFL